MHVQLDINYIADLRKALSEFYLKVADFYKDQGVGSAPCSQASNEQARFPRPESLVSAWSIATQLIESSSEHVTAFVKTITEPMEPIACWTCVRSMLESSALAAWLMDPGIDAHTRVGRVFAFRYEGLEQQLKLCRVIGHKDTKLVEARIDKVEKVAISLGYSPVRNSKDRRIGIGQQMPSATEVIRLMLDEETMYRILSAVAHGHHWAIIQLGFKPSADVAGSLQIGGVTVKSFEKTPYVVGLAYLGLGAVKALARAVWYHCRFFGWDEKRLTSLFEVIFDKLRAGPTVRFWRVSPRDS